MDEKSILNIEFNNYINDFLLLKTFVNIKFYNYKYYLSCIIRVHFLNYIITIIFILNSDLNFFNILFK